jgi:hypothetical protein
MIELKGILSEYTARLKKDTSVFMCDDGENGKFIPVGNLGELGRIYAEIDRGEFDYLINKIKADAVREAIEHADEIANDAKDWISIIKRYVNKLERGEL